jgi:peptidyl-prolyl cis-trans isomerase A (cyclophilin A)
MRKTQHHSHIRIVLTLAGLCALLFVLVSGGPSQAAKPGLPQAVIQTNMGNIEIELNAAKAPNTVKNFLQYVNSNFYDGTMFHRVIKGFMIQGGGFTKVMEEKNTQAPIAAESNNGLKNDRGTVAMARTSDPNSATSQFFINTRDNDRLNYSSQQYRGTVIPCSEKLSKAWMLWIGLKA